MIICDCGKFIGSADRFRDFIKTSSSPSTSTFGHRDCGFIFNLVDGKPPKKYSSKKELKSMAMVFASKNGLSNQATQKFLLLIDRLKRDGNFSDYDILTEAQKQLIIEDV